MSTTDNAFSATLEPIDTPKTTLKQRWWHIMDNWKVGIVPLPLFLLAGGLIALDCLGGKLPSDIVVMVATLAFFGFACGEFGKRLPLIGKTGTCEQLGIRRQTLYNRLDKVTQMVGVDYNDKPNWSMLLFAAKLTKSWQEQHGE